MKTKAGLCLVSALCVSALGVAAREPCDIEGRRLSDWYAGPARYVLSKQETKKFRRLRTDEDRLAYIEGFWKNHDPIPETAESETRNEFCRRVAYANQRFADSAKPGWRTDRGKIHVLMGAPQEKHTQPNSRQRRGIEEWIYYNTPQSDLGPHFVVAFAKDTTGEYRLSLNPLEDADPWAKLAPNSSEEAQRFEDRAALVQPVPFSFTELGLMMDMARIQRVPQPEGPQETVTTEQFFSVLPFSVAYDHYLAADGTTDTTITVEIPNQIAVLGDGSPGDVRMLARLEHKTVEGLVYTFSHDGSFAPAWDALPSGQPWVIQSGEGLVPGEYSATYNLYQQSTNRTGIHNDRVTVPNLSDDQLSLSSLTLARELQPLAELDAVVDPEVGRPFVRGRFRVVPRARAVVRADEDFHLYFQVYGATLSPDDGRPRLDVEYRFFVRTETEHRPIGPPVTFDDQRAAVQGWSFPLRVFPPATYRLEVSVKDRQTGDVTASGLGFQVVAAPDPVPTPAASSEVD